MKRLAFLLLGGALILQSCSNEAEVLKQQNQALQAQLTEDSTLLAQYNTQIQDIDQALGEAMRFNAEMSQTENMDRMDALAKISKMSEMISSSTARITELEGALKTKSSRYSALKRSLDKKKALLEEQVQMIDGLKTRVSELETENVNLKSEVEAQSLALAAGQDSLQVARAEITATQKRLNQSIEDAEAAAQKAHEEMIATYISIGDELLQSAKDNKNMFGKKQREQATREAYSWFCKADKAGGSEGLTRLSAIESDKRLAKYVKDMNCDK